MTNIKKANVWLNLILTLVT